MPSSGSRKLVVSTCLLLLLCYVKVYKYLDKLSNVAIYISSTINTFAPLLHFL